MKGWVRYSHYVATTQRKPPGNPPTPGARNTGKPPTKKQRRNQAAVRSVSLSARRPWQSPTIVTSVSVGIVAVVLIIIVVINQVGGTGNASTSTPLSATVANAILHPDTSVISTVGSGKQSGELTRLPGDTVLESKGKPMIVYVGAEYCPFCAAERWVIAYWLSRFGTFKGLKEIQSSSTDVYPDTHTFTFYKSSYSSPYVDFSGTELYDRNQAALQTPTSQVASLYTTWDQPPYTAEAEGYPFIDIAGLYALYNTSYSPQLLANLTWNQIAAKLSDPTDPVTQAIVGNANILTAATCIATQDSPASVCSTPTIQAIEPALKAEKVPTS
jgi:hypothetical protein